MPVSGHLVAPPQRAGGVVRAGDFHSLGPGGFLGPGLALKPPRALVIILGLFAAEGMVADLIISTGFWPVLAPASAPLKLDDACSTVSWWVGEGVECSSARGSLAGSYHSSVCDTGEADDKGFTS